MRIEGMQNLGLCCFCNNILDDLTSGIIKSGKTSNFRGNFSKCSWPVSIVIIYQFDPFPVE